jgi:acyl carrier protein
LDVRTDLISLIDSTLNLGGRAAGFNDSTPLLGAVPELDSMGVVSLLTAFEDRLGLTVDDDEIDGSVFATFGSLRSFVENKLAAG